MKTLVVLALIFGALSLHAQVDLLEGVWQGYDGEWLHVSRQLVALAEAIPAEKYAWRSGPGVRSTSEVFMHIAIANFGLLNVTGVKLPSDLKSTVGGMYLRIIIHANEHMGQLVAYARMNGIVPPWSK